MNAMFLRLAIAVAALCGFSWTTPARAADDGKVVGTWKWSWTDQNGTTRNRELRIKSEGGKLAAVVVREQGQESPVKEIHLDGDTLKLSYSAERNGQTFNIEYEGKINGDTLQGTSRSGDRTREWTAKREPVPASASPGKVDEKGWIDLIKGASIAESGWTLRRAEDDKHKNFWSIKDGVLTSKPADGKGGIDIVHEKSFRDFELHVEFNVPAGSNSGVYLRGIYEIQVEDTHGKPVTKTVCGSVYNQQAVSEDVAKAAGEWQTFDITLKDNKITVIHNEKKVIDAFEVKGKTGGALGDEKVKHGEPGPVMLQGDHGEIHFRRIRIRPLPSTV